MSFAHFHTGLLVFLSVCSFLHIKSLFLWHELKKVFFSYIIVFWFCYGFCHAGSFYEIELMDLSFYCFWILNHRKAFLIPALQRNLLRFSCVYVMVSINVYIFDTFRICTEVYCEVSPTLSFFQIAFWLSQKSYVYSTDLNAFIACKIARCLWDCFWKFYSILLHFYFWGLYLVIQLYLGLKPSWFFF